MRSLPLLFLLLLPIVTLPGNGEEETLTILYTASLNGNLDGCDCRSYPRAGLVKRAAWVRAFPQRERALLVDAGDILDVSPDDLLAREILEVYGELGYTAVAVGDQELSNGMEKLLEYRKLYPLISHNLTLCPDETRCVFFSMEAPLVKVRSIPVGILSLVDPEVFALYPQELKDKLKIADPAAVASNLVQDLQERGARLIVALYHGFYESALALAKRTEGIDVLILGHEQRLVEPQKLGNTVLVSPGEEGNRIGILTVSWRDRGKPSYANQFRIFLYERDPDDPRVRRRIAEYRNALREPLKSRGGS